eukprot:scaffold407819_cov48-Prasinocladus_malaysianus.AAC.2
METVSIHNLNFLSMHAIMSCQIHSWKRLRPPNISSDQSTHPDVFDRDARLGKVAPKVLRHIDDCVVTGANHRLRLWCPGGVPGAVAGDGQEDLAGHMSTHTSATI